MERYKESWGSQIMLLDMVLYERKDREEIAGLQTTKKPVDVLSMTSTSTVVEDDEGDDGPVHDELDLNETE